MDLVQFGGSLRKGMAGLGGLLGWNLSVLDGIQVLVARMGSECWFRWFFEEMVDFI
jgi:hypothetical protein